MLKKNKIGFYKRTPCKKIIKYNLNINEEGKSVF
jgi:hypothetical protein